MKTTCKRVLLFSLLVLTFVCLLTVSASAASYANDDAALAAGMAVRVGAQGGDYYATLADAVTADSAGAEVFVIANHTTNAATVNGTLTVNGNGFTVTYQGDASLFTVNGTLTLKDVTLQATAGKLATFASSGTLTFESGLYKAKNAVALSQGATGSVFFSGGDFTLTDTAVSTPEGSSNSANVYFAGANVIGTAQRAPLVAADVNNTGAFFVSAGTLESDYRIFTGAVRLEISGGTLNALNRNEGMAVWINAGDATNTYVKMTGGTINAALRALGTSKGSPITVSDGTINMSGGPAHSAAIFTESVAAKITVTGGTFCNTVACPQALVVLQADTLMNVYGGTFIGNTRDDVSQLLVKSGSTLNVYGGYFRHTGYANVRVDRTAGVFTTANIYGGTFEINGTTNFYAEANNYTSTINLYAYNAIGTASSRYIRFCGTSDDNSVLNIFHLNTHRVCSYNSLEIKSGASIRLVEGTDGIRFTSTVPKSWIDMIEAQGATSLSYGTVIVPTDYLVDLTAFSVEALEAAGKTYLNIPAVNGITTQTDGSLTLHAVMCRIDPTNYDRAFSAIVYAKYTLNNETVVHYAHYSASNNSRKIVDVATEALRDCKDEQTDKYRHAITVNDQEKFSRYNAQRQTILLKYAPNALYYEVKSVDLYLIAGQSNASGYGTFNEAFADNKPQFTQGYSHVLYSGHGTSGTNGKLVNVVDLARTKAGQGGSTKKMGAELGMADILSKYYNAKSGKTACIVKAADGGTNLLDVVGSSNARIGNWMPPSICEADGYIKTDANRTGAQYRGLIANVETAIANLKAEGYTEINVMGFFWMQGCAERAKASMTFNGQTVEMDYNSEDYTMLSFDESVPYSYPNVFKALVNDIRSDVGALVGKNLSEMPVVVGEISDSFGRSHQDHEARFVAMQQKLADFIDNCYVIDSAKLAVGFSNDDTAHWSAEDMLLVGQMVGTKLVNHNFNADLAHPATVGTKVAAVYGADGKLIAEYSHLSYALNTAPAGATVKMLRNVTIDAAALSIANRNAITWDGQGFALISNDDEAALRFIGTNITIKNLTVLPLSGASASKSYEAAKVHADRTVSGL